MTSVQFPTTSIADALKPPAPQAATTGNQTLGQDTFLKLLVAQLRYQDPMAPTQGTEFLSQTATFTQVEKLEEISRATSEMLAAQTVLGTSGLVGKSVTYVGPDGLDVSGTVTAARFGAGGATLRVGDTDVPVGAVKEVRTTSAD